MKIGIVGNAADKFTRATRDVAKRAIHDVIEHYGPELIISGGCHLGGIDEWAEETANDLGVETLIHTPYQRTWKYYKQRNLRIANDADLVVCIVAGQYPKKFDGRRFSVCYHCRRSRPFHIKSGGCWTAMECGLSQWRIVSKDGWLTLPLKGHFMRGGKLAP